jgi:hypothetical protein
MNLANTSMSLSPAIELTRRLMNFLSFFLVGLLMMKLASGQTVVEFNYDSRTVVALRVNSAALQKLLPSGWEVDPVPSGPLKGANIFVGLYQSMVDGECRRKTYLGSNRSPIVARNPGQE